MSIWGKLLSAIVTLFVACFLLTLISVVVFLILDEEYLLATGPVFGIYFLAAHAYESIRTKF